MKKTTKAKTKTGKRKKESSDTAASLLIDCHYEKIGVRRVWNRDRVERMCSFLRMTYHELGSLVGVKNLDQKILKTRKLPLSVCLLLTLVESQFMGRHIPDPIINLFKFTED